MPRHWTPLNLAVRFGCHLTYETPVPTSVLFVLKPRLEGRVLVMQERLSFGIGLPSCAFQDPQGNLVPVGRLPSELLSYILPSRYCDSDKLMNFAWNQFGQIPISLCSPPPPLLFSCWLWK